MSQPGFESDVGYANEASRWDERWGPPVSWPGRCIHPVVVTVGAAPAPWSRLVDLALRRRGLLHWKIAKDPYLPWLPVQANAMLIIRHVQLGETPERLCEELQRCPRGPTSGMVVVIPWPEPQWQWVLRSQGALEVLDASLLQVSRVADVARRIMERWACPHPDPPIPACWLVPSQPTQLAKPNR